MHRTYYKYFCYSESTDELIDTSVVLRGSMDLEIWDPMNGLHRVLWKGLECAEGCREKECSPNRCMEIITVNEVLGEVRAVIGGRS